jgi:hypothetical protein
VSALAASTSGSGATATSSQAAPSGVYKPGAQATQLAPLAM